MLEQEKGIPASRSIVPQRVTVRHEFPIGQQPKVYGVSDPDLMDKFAN